MEIRLIEREPVRKKKIKRQVRVRVRGRRPFFGRVRGVFGFLFFATVLIFAFCFRADLQEYIVSKLYNWSQAETKSNSLRQNALDHEREVNRAAQ
jgi:hypothetical protein